MRKVAFILGLDSVRKVMLYECTDGVYFFGYDCLQDASSISDYFYETIEDAEDFCKDRYNIESDNWILIADPLDNCQHDFILPTKVKGKEIGSPEWGHFQTLVDSRWVDIGTLDKIQSFGGMTVNERLFVSGLISEFELARQNDKANADKILLALDVTK